MDWMSMLLSDGGGADVDDSEDRGPESWSSDFGASGHKPPGGRRHRPSMEYRWPEDSNEIPLWDEHPGLPHYQQGSGGPVRRGHYAMVGNDDDELAYLAPGSQVFGKRDLTNPEFRVGSDFDPLSPKYFPQMHEDGGVYDGDFDPEDEDEGGPVTPFPQRPDDGDTRPHGFWESFGDSMGRDPFAADIGTSPLEIALGVGMAVANHFANKGGKAVADRRDRSKNLLSQYDEDVKQKEREDRARLLRVLTARNLRKRREAKDKADKARYESEHVTDPKTGKSYPASSEPGLRLSNPDLASKVYPPPASPTSASANTTFKDDEAAAEAEYKGAVDNFTREKAWEMAGGDPQRYSLFPPQKLPKSVADPDTAASVKPYRRKWLSKQVVSALYSAKTEADLDAAVARAQREGVYEEQEVRDAIDKVAKTHGW